MALCVALDSRERGKGRDRDEQAQVEKKGCLDHVVDMVGGESEE
jgi:hypothetical protein